MPIGADQIGLVIEFIAKLYAMLGVLPIGRGSSLMPRCFFCLRLLETKGGTQAVKIENLVIMTFLAVVSSSVDGSCSSAFASFRKVKHLRT